MKFKKSPDALPARFGQKQNKNQNQLWDVSGAGIPHGAPDGGNIRNLYRTRNLKTAHAMNKSGHMIWTRFFDNLESRSEKKLANQFPGGDRRLFRNKLHPVTIPLWMENQVGYIVLF